MRKTSATTLMLGAAVLSGAAAAALGQWYIDTEISAYRNELDEALAPVKVVVALSDLPVGTELSHAQVAVRPVPQAFVSKDAVLPDQFTAVSGKTLSVAVGRGDPILFPFLAERSAKPFSARIGAGLRAMTFQVDEVSSQSGMISPGDHVDLLATLTEDGEASTFRLLADVPILATGNVLDEGRGPDTDLRFRTVTMVVSPEQAARIAHARATGSLTLIVRAPGDGTASNVSRVTKRSLLGARPATGSDRPIEVILGGRP